VGLPFSGDRSFFLKRSRRGLPRDEIMPCLSTVLAGWARMSSNRAVRLVKPSQEPIDRVDVAGDGVPRLPVTPQLFLVTVQL
jgi:hypothetical protein